MPLQVHNNLFIYPPVNDILNGITILRNQLPICNTNKDDDIHQIKAEI